LIKVRKEAPYKNQQVHVHQPQKSAMQTQKLMGICKISADFGFPLLRMPDLPLSLCCKIMIVQPVKMMAGVMH